MLRTRWITALNAVTDTTTSDKFYVGGARRIGILFRRADHSAGSSAFSVKASLEPLSSANNGGKDLFGNPKGGTGVTVSAINTLIDNVTNSNVQNLTRVNGKTLAANGDAMVWLDPNTMPINWLEITVTETTDGTHSAFILVEEEGEI